jgi:undecaprenyl-diphosphatase
VQTCIERLQTKREFNLKLLRRSQIDYHRDAQIGERSWWDIVGVVDWPITRLLGLRKDRRVPLVVANFLSRIGDGPIYLLIVCALTLFHPHEIGTILLCALPSIAVLHVIYPSLKRFTARPRPRDMRPIFPDSPHPALDKFSFPSGHVMTLTAALTPIVYVNPRTWPLSVAAWGAMAWSRLAIGQHFATDVAAGTILGAAVSGGVTYLLAY